ncbi:hypothetical protein QJS83_00605 [Bdellovibrio sp. 22V]|uniref:hypothetical protein n=1 Tax=Bdellovibrio TaxID=958 RepID=UPI002543922A|nr:hypothetical protein [Bdellovibrio sp. 22V]WII72365.1 hypothetical protein QJS83_00605 [Bdellovibrio sp. 22V]
MKSYVGLFLVMASAFVYSTASASGRQCQVEVSVSAKGRVTHTVELEVRVKPGLDLASYVYEGKIEGFEVYIMEVDGNYFASIKFNGVKTFAEGQEGVTANLRTTKRSLQLTCPSR